MNLLNTMEIPPHLVEQISRGKCVLFIGAGVSKRAGLPNWSDLLHNMLKYCEENTIHIPNSSEIEEEIIEESYLIAADQIRECMDKHNTLAFHRFIINEINRKEVKLTDVHEAITKLPINVILTTNYDKLIERAYDQHVRINFANGTHFGNKLLLIQEDIQNGKKIILHIHGRADVPDTIILGTKDYNKFQRRSVCNRILQDLIASNTILFIGFSFNDPNILFQMDKLKKLFGQAPGKHYALMSLNRANKWRNQKSDSFKEINIIPYKDDADESVNIFLNNLLIQTKKLKDAEKFEDKREAHELNVDYGNARFHSIGRFEPKTPMELFKQNEKEGITSKNSNLLQLIADISGKKYFQEQIDLAQKEGYADLYSNSWVDRELQIIGLHLLYKLFKNSQEEMRKEKFVLNNMYDAGCSNWGQYKALLAFREWERIPLSDNFKYHAQDFNPQWHESTPKENCIFYQINLPHFEKSLEDKCDLVCCAHSLHYLGKNPLAIYSSFFSFNRLLHSDGYCYVTVPEKNSLPGMPDLLEMAARDAGFEIKDKGKKRLVHRLDETPHNITTFYYLILKKERPVDFSRSNRLIGASLFKGKALENAKDYGITEAESIRDISPAFEDSLKSIINTENINVRTFKCALEVVMYEEKKNIININEWKKYVDRIQCLIMSLGSSRIYSIEIKYKLQKACSDYLRWLLRYLISTDDDNSYKTKKIIEYLNSPTENLKDIRVNTDELSCEHIARLIKHLFELCLYERINILRDFEKTYNMDCED
ncbi:SIR2 family protein [Methanosarcina sp. Z-7115]|uniref:SIR2 family protein n=1 Tax=Methanosarcina baikalica TaxID=3073890 RepID=A0ABU2D018_9EURY|nr:SIR2 family protein [Methanosarcina sp. Z-7115]MDR7665331.1 SIR2 family protein [Methanosarcina sp. Z-7115]